MRMSADSGFRLGARWVDASASEIEGVRVDVKAMEVLIALVEARPAVLSVPELLERVWPNVVVVDNVVYQAISQLRRALGDDARSPCYIESVPRRGYRLIAGTAAQEPDSVAVLRFVDMSPSQDQAPLCAGIAEEILNRLARIRELKVVGRTSSFQFDPSNANIREISQRLGVRHVLEGSVRTAGNRVRISARLVECEGGLQRWSESYTRELIDLFTLYDEVAEAISRELNVIISHPPNPLTPTRSAEALKLVTQIRFQILEARPSQALFPLLKQAVALDPDYADAYLAQGMLYYVLADGGYEPPQPSLEGARQFLDKALLINPALADAHEFMGNVRANLDLDFGSAAESFQQADRLRGYSLKYRYLCLAGRFESAERNCRRCIELDPLYSNPRMWLGRCLDRLGRIDEATQAFEAAFALSPRHPNRLGALVDHLLDFAGEVDRAAQFIEDAERTLDKRFVLARARIAHARGDSGPLRSLVERYVANRDARFVSSRIIEDLYYRLGDYASHIHWFAVREREKDNLSIVPLTLRDRPDYWERLSDWAYHDRAHTRPRMTLINEHRARIDRITERMVLPHDYVE